MEMIRQWWRRRQAKRLPFADNWFAATLARVPAMQSLSSSERVQLAALAREFMAGKNMVGANGLKLDAAIRTRIATLAAWPALHLGYAALDGWTDLIVYNEAFRARRRERDPITGVIHEYDQHLAGEAWSSTGPLVLSLHDLTLDLNNPEYRQNVVVHEIAHKIDGLDGTVNGRPPLHRGMSAQAWADDFGSAYADLVQRLERFEHSAINPYAAHSPAEFFAVSSEYHFVHPHVLALQYPKVARHLQQFYGGAVAV
jgi:hypothetical protein